MDLGATVAAGLVGVVAADQIARLETSVLSFDPAMARFPWGTIRGPAGPLPVALLGAAGRSGDATDGPPGEQTD